ncbi:PD-(D/E)XK nuclease family protein [Devosia rhodophyticola]|uniref:PD-(D/E)XK nuclease family protein n=1 Tax=Devosia rhodophyticola TaxID=3026423 RepID=A0ABY7YZW9_9HYPH|nr:PD-(D/E)XK nuclease family protein [Devosia rhodophyticola]WDR06918.1 PD-(D/E)XK nuclease family protein [Devosia rhodophyticola]
MAGPIARARCVDDAAGSGHAAAQPPADLRPRRLSITEIETLFRSPYDLYAKYILGLKPMDALGEEAGGRERGSIIHEIFGRFIEEGHDVMAENALSILNELAIKGFSGLDAISQRRDIWMRRFTTAAQLFLEFERDRNHLVRQRHAEISGKWDLPLPFLLSGRADRIDEMVDGSLQIIDFKTGSPPSAGEMKRFEAPQLLLEAAMAGDGAFADIAAAKTSALTYIKIGLGPEAFVEKPFSLDDGFDLMDAAEESSLRMQRHINEFLFRERPMVPRLFPSARQRFAGAYEHLARTDEWSLIGGEDEE